MGRPALSLATAGKIRVWHEVNGQWSARCLYRDADGRSRTVERTRATRAAAERALKEALRDRTYAATADDISADTKVKVLADAWWVDFETRGTSSGTRRLYRSRLDSVIIPALGELRVRELTVGTVHRHLQVVARANGPGTAKTCRAILSGMCQFAAQRDALDRNPVRDAGPARQVTPKRLPISLTVVEARQLRAFLTYDDRAIHHDVPDLVGFMLATGARIGEACALTWDAVDLETGIVEIRGTKTAAAVRTVRLPAWAIMMLNDRPKSHAVGLVFPTTTGTLRDPSNVQKRLKEAFARAGFQITSHALRKTVASLMEAEGLSARAAADQLGHSKVSVTQDVYFGRGVAETGAAAVLEALA